MLSIFFGLAFLVYGFFATMHGLATTTFAHGFFMTFVTTAIKSSSSVYPCATIPSLPIAIRTHSV